MDKTITERQRRYRKQIVQGKRKRLQFVIDTDEAKKLDEICASEGLNKTEFLREVIRNWKTQKNTV